MCEEVLVAAASPQRNGVSSSPSLLTFIPFETLKGKKPSTVKKPAGITVSIFAYKAFSTCEILFTAQDVDMHTFGYAKMSISRTDIIIAFELCFWQCPWKDERENNHTSNTIPHHTLSDMHTYAMGVELRSKVVFCCE